MVEAMLDPRSLLENPPPRHRVAALQCLQGFTEWDLHPETNINILVLVGFGPLSDKTWPLRPLQSGQNREVL